MLHKSISTVHAAAGGGGSGAPTYTHSLRRVFDAFMRVRARMVVRAYNVIYVAFTRRVRGAFFSMRWTELVLGKEGGYCLSGVLKLLFCMISTC